MNERPSIYRWWIQDYSPLDGRLRAVVYLLLLFLGIDGLIFGAVEFLRRCPDEFFQPPGVMQWVFFFTPTRIELIRLLEVLPIPLIVVWILAAAGCGGRLPLILTGFGAAFFYGCQQCCVGTGHGWHLAVGALLLCGVLVRPDAWSLDAYFSTRWQRWPFHLNKQSTADLSPYARKMILLLAVYILFAAGVTKLIQSGLAWMDGVSLYFYLEHHNHPSTPLGKWLLGVLLKHPSYVMCLAVATVVFELAILAALFFRRSRWLLFIGACGFHIGIYLLMYPRYFEQMVVYLLVLPWEIFQVKSWQERWGMLLGFRSLPSPSVARSLPRPLVQYGLVSFAGVTVLVLAGTVVCQREWFPLTHVPMYSSYVSSERIGTIAREEFGSLAGLVRLAARNRMDDLPWWSKYEIGKRIVVYGSKGENEIRVPLAPEFPHIVLNQFLWAQRASSSLLNDLRGTESIQSAGTGSFKNMERIASGIREAISKASNWECFEKFDICFDGEDTGPVPLTTFYR